MGTGARPVPISREHLLAFQGRAIAERVPLTGSIAMTHRCNLRCVHCYLGEERLTAPETGERDAAFWCSIIDQIAAAGCLNLLITGGEPFLRRDFAEIYTRAKKRGLLITVFTNGTLLDETLLDLFADLPPRLVEITLYGATQTVYEKVTGIRGSFGRCLVGIEALRTRGIRVGLKTMILTENREEIPAMRRMAGSRGLDFRLDPALFPCRDGHPGPLDHRIPPAEAVAIEMEDREFLEKATAYFEKTRGFPPQERLYGCMAGLTSFHVDPAGTLLPCLMVATHGFDLRQGGFLTGWREVIPRFREQSVTPEFECHRCEKRVLCGLCPASFGMETGSPYRKSEYICRLGQERYRILRASIDSRTKGVIVNP